MYTHKSLGPLKMVLKEGAQRCHSPSHWLPQAGPDGTKHPVMGPDVVRLCYALDSPLRKGRATSQFKRLGNSAKSLNTSDERSCQCGKGYYQVSLCRVGHQRVGCHKILWLRSVVECYEPKFHRRFGVVYGALVPSLASQFLGAGSTNGIVTLSYMFLWSIHFLSS